MINIHLHLLIICLRRLLDQIDFIAPLLLIALLFLIICSRLILCLCILHGVLCLILGGCCRLVFIMIIALFIFLSCVFSFCNAFGSISRMRNFSVESVWFFLEIVSGNHYYMFWAYDIIIRVSTKFNQKSGSLIYLKYRWNSKSHIWFHIFWFEFLAVMLFTHVFNKYLSFYLSVQWFLSLSSLCL